MSNKKLAKELLGELFITGIEGHTLTDHDKDFLETHAIGGIILFSKNFQSPPQVASLISTLQTQRNELPLWISVDQEGGRVQRFKNGFTKLPTAEQIGNTNSPKIAFQIAELTAIELAQVGININYSPVADIMTNPNNPVIGDRAFGAQEDTVSKMVTATVRGLLTHGVQPCVKHFPGHGDTELDSHFDLPSVSTPASVLSERELKPFLKAFKSRCSMVMTAHIVNREIDKDWPATLSERTLQGLLRQELKYSRLIISDDMEMKAIVDHFGIEDSSRLAIAAGCDLLIYRTLKGAKIAYLSLLESIDSGKIDPLCIIESAQRSMDLKRQFFNAWRPLDPEQVPMELSNLEHQNLVKIFSSTA
jgi:beta-N-acetylhexosaminidase